MAVVCSCVADALLREGMFHVQDAARTAPTNHAAEEGASCASLMLSSRGKAQSVRPCRRRATNPHSRVSIFDRDRRPHNSRPTNTSRDSGLGLILLFDCETAANHTPAIKGDLDVRPY